MGEVSCHFPKFWKLEKISERLENDVEVKDQSTGHPVYISKKNTAITHKKDPYE